MSDEWVAPGTAATQPRPAEATTPGTGPPAPVLVRGPVPRPLPLRPLSVLEQLDAGFAIVRSRPLLLLGLAAAVQMPMSIVAAVIRRGLFDGDLEDGIHFNTLILSAAPGDSAWAALVGFLWFGMAQFIGAAATAVVVGAWYVERDASTEEVVGFVVRRAPILIAAFVLVQLAVVFGVMVAVVGAVWVWLHMLVVAPVMGVERVGPIRAVRRSYRLVRFRRGPAFAFLVSSLLMIAALNLVLFWLPLLLASLVGLPTSLWLLAAGGILAGVVSTAVSAAALVALYIDLRVRLEGIDLQLLMVERFASS